MEKIGIKFDTSSMLSMLSNSLYDTPLVFLRENLQNAYDAVLLRKHKDEQYKDERIDININGSSISIIDNGIGMSKEELEENYWTAGRSGKNNPEARAAGVVGTFGIGALANFGICQLLEIHTRRYDAEKSITCLAEKDKYDEITIQTDEVASPIGTKIIATIQNGKNISLQDAECYLKPFVEYLSIPVYFNGHLISKKEYVPKELSTQELHKCDEIIMGTSVSFYYAISVKQINGVLSKVYIKNIVYEGEVWNGDMFLSTEKNNLFGLRNGFGLSALTVSSIFKFGGLVNLSILVPTAGREAITQSCTAKIQRVLNVIDRLCAEYISRLEIADLYQQFLVYTNSHFNLNLVKNIKIQLYGDNNERIPLSEIMKCPSRYKYFEGSNIQYLSSFAGSEFSIVVVSREYPRKDIQKKFLRELGVEQLKQEVKVQKDWNSFELGSAYMSLTIAIQRTLERDYLILKNDVHFSEITLGAKVFVEKNDMGIVNVHIAKDSPEINAVLEIYKSSYGIFESIVKDYVRNYIYQQILPYIPSSSKEGIAQVCSFLRQNQESLEISLSDTSLIDKSYELYKEKKITADELADRIKRDSKISRQQITQENIEDVSTIVQTNSSLLDFSKPTMEPLAQTARINRLEPIPSIMRQNISTRAKLLQTEESNPLLHNYKQFITVTPNMYAQNLYFFFNPHSTRVIWSMHRIIYIFSLWNNSYTLYYDMELKKHLNSSLTGGEEMFSTTIITKDKLFVPVPLQLYDYFSIKDEPLKFNIRFNGVESDLGQKELE